MALSQTVKGMMASVAPVLGYALDAGAAELPVQAAASPSHRLAAVESVLCHRIDHLRPLMDPRVLRRAAKDLWNACAGVSPAGVPFSKPTRSLHPPPSQCPRAAWLQERRLQTCLVDPHARNFYIFRSS